MTSALVFPIGWNTCAVLMAAEQSPPATRADTRQMLVSLLAAGVVIGVVSVAIAVANRIARHRRFNSHPSLFRGLCKVHGLDSASRRLLKRVVRFHRLAQPARLFIEPNWLDPASLGASFQGQASELEKLRNGLFQLRPTATESE